MVAVDPIKEYERKFALIEQVKGILKVLPQHQRLECLNVALRLIVNDSKHLEDIMEAWKSLGYTREDIPAMMFYE